MTIQTYKNVPLDVSEHPYCKAFWKMDEPANVGAPLKCAVTSENNIYLTGTRVGTLNANGISLNFSGTGASSWRGLDLSGKDFIVAFSGAIGGGFSDGAGIGIPPTASVYFAGPSNLVIASNTITGDVGAGATDRVGDTAVHNQYAIQIVGGNSNTSIDGTLDSVGIPTQASVGDVVLPSTVGLSGVTETYGLAVFAWEAGNLPANYENVMAWMFNEWRNGRKVLPPMWRGTE